jgi:hypothetical protein
MFRTTASIRRLKTSAIRPQRIPSPAYKPAFTPIGQAFRRTMASNSFEEAAERQAQRIGEATKTKVNHWSHPGPAAFDFRST